MLSIALRNFAIRLAVTMVMSLCQHAGAARAAVTIVTVDNFSILFAASAHDGDQPR
jgi:hypothetical protein